MKYRCGFYDFGMSSVCVMLHGGKNSRYKQTESIECLHEQKLIQKYADDVVRNDRRLGYIRLMQNIFKQFESSFAALDEGINIQLQFKTFTCAFVKFLELKEKNNFTSRHPDLC